MSISLSKIATERGRRAGICSIVALVSVAIVGAGAVWQKLRVPQTKHLSASGAPAARPAFAWADADGDGFPDSLSLRGSDAENFRRWFTLIAEFQFYRISPKWQPEQRDCSGLIRFAMREALKRHTHGWMADFGGDARLAAAAPEDLRASNLDEVLTGDRLFRTHEGQFQPSDLNDGTFAQFADARTLKAFNTRFITRDLSLAKPGDLIFFYDPRAGNFPYHVMLFLGLPAWEAEGAHDWVVYHTGASATDPGVVKKVRLAELSNHPDRRWHPVQANPCFLGFYRLKILD